MRNTAAEEKHRPVEASEEELHNAQVTLGAERVRYESLYDQAPVGYCTLSEQELILEANLVIAGLLGVARDELIKQPIARFVVKEDQDTYHFLRERTVEVGKTQTCELRMVRPNGTAFWAHLLRTLVRAEGGSTQCLLVMTDITERRRVDDELRASEARFRDMFEQSTIGKVMTGRDGRLLRVNQAFADMLGYSLEELQRLTLPEITHPEDLPGSLAFVRALVAGECTSYRMEERYRHRDGSWVFADTSATLLPQIPGTPPCLLASIVDISDRKRATAALAASEALTRGILENVQDAYVRADRDGHILMVSPSAVSLYGYGSMAEMIGLPTTALYAAEEERQSIVEEIQQRGGVRDRVGKARRKDGTIFWVSLNARFFQDEQGRVAGAECFVRDISERKRAEEALRASEDRYAELVNKTDTGFVVVDEQGVVLSANEPYMRLAGARRIDDVVGHSVMEWTAPDERMNNAEAVALCARQGSIRDFETVYQHADGTRLDIVVDASVGWQPGGTRCLASLCRNITERKRAQTQIHDQRATLNALLESVDGPIFSLDREYRYTSFNSAHAGAMKALYSAEPRLGRSLAEYQTVPEDWQAARTNIDRALRGEIVLESAFSGDDELSRRYFEVAHYPVRAATREIIGVSVFAREVTERKRAEEALRQSEQRLRRFYESGLLGVIYWNIAGRITDANDRFLEMVGYTRSELEAGQIDWLAMTPPEYRHLDEASLGELGRNKGVFEKEYVRKDGTRIQITIAGAMLDDTRVNGVAFVQDISERKRAEAERQKLEDQLRAAQRMEAIGLLAGGVAHDFNNLLSVILCSTDFAMARVRGDDRLRDELVEVRKAGERAVGLTRQLLAFSRKQVLQPAVLSLNRIAEGVEKMLRRLLREDIEFLQVLAPDLGEVLADPGQLEQVLMNLVVNARDAMPDGGKLTIETRNVDLDEEYAARHVSVKPGRYIECAVSDTGCGMDKTTQARIFEPFFTTKEQGKGTGLGLSTVYGIVKQSGGNIWVYSEPGRGTTFKIYLPRTLSHPTTVTASRLAAITTRPSGTETILVVEDEEAMRGIAKRILGEAGYHVLTAANADDALRLCDGHEGRIDLLLTDVVMPQTSGRVLAERLALGRPETKVLFMSGYADEAIVRHGALAPGTHFISKPFRAQDLTKKVRQVLENEIGHPETAYTQALNERARSDERPLAGLLQAVPPDVLARLWKAVVAARYDEVVAPIESVRTGAPELATRLRDKADIFDYDGLRCLLRR